MSCVLWEFDITGAHDKYMMCVYMMCVYMMCADDNSARDAVVKKILQQANSVWLVSNIRRAVNDKTTKDMLPPNFKQVKHTK